MCWKTLLIESSKKKDGIWIWIYGTKTARKIFFSRRNKCEEWRGHSCITRIEEGGGKKKRVGGSPEKDLLHLFHLLLRSILAKYREILTALPLRRSSKEERYRLLEAVMRLLLMYYYRRK